MRVPRFRFVLAIATAAALLPTARAHAQLAEYHFTGNASHGSGVSGWSLEGTVVLDLGAAPTTTEAEAGGGEKAEWVGGAFALDAFTYLGSGSSVATA